MLHEMMKCIPFICMYGTVSSGFADNMLECYHTQKHGETGMCYGWWDRDMPYFDIQELLWEQDTEVVILERNYEKNSAYPHSGVVTQERSLPWVLHSFITAGVSIYWASTGIFICYPLTMPFSLRSQTDLSIYNGEHIGGNIGWYVFRLCFNDRYGIVRTQKTALENSIICIEVLDFVI